MVLQPAFSEESCLTFSSASRSSSSSSMSRSYTVDSSPPSSPEPGARMDNVVESGAYATHGTNKEGTRQSTKNVAWRVDLEGDDRERDMGNNSSQHSPVHPYSASTLSTMTSIMHKSPTLYEKNGERATRKRPNPRLSIKEKEKEKEDEMKDFIPRSQLKEMEQANRERTEDNYLKDDLARASTGGGLSFESSFDPDDALWDDAIDKIIDVAGHTIDLSNMNLTKISTRIADLENLVVLEGGTSASGRGTISRTNSAMTRTFSRSTTSSVFGADSLGAQAREIHLFLMNNHITTLPGELFRLDMLVTLSLRSNRLEKLPPLISRLHSLRELNVANNKLKYLPREIMDLKLSSLSVEMNPFLVPNESLKYGPLMRRHRIMPLAEQSLRVLFQPAMDARALDPTRSKSETLLEALYDIPLEPNFLPPNVKAILSACVPGSVAVPSSSRNETSRPPSDARTPLAHVHSHPPAPPPYPCISTCPSRKHLIIDGASPTQYRTPVFVDHAEELYSWEKEIAGCKVGGEYGVPVLWRGCSAGCLDGLSDDPGASIFDPKSSGDDNDGEWDMDVDAPVMQRVDDSDGEGLPECNPAQFPNGEQSAPFSSEDFEFDD